MEPRATAARPSGMRSLALSAAALMLPLSLTGCGGGDDDVATDPAPTAATSTPSPTPTAAPTVGTYPHFEPTDYTFELTISCFCAGANVPVEVTVANAVVVGAVYAADDEGGRMDVHQGDPADQRYQLTINDVIDHANDTEAATVTVDWPAGQDYPSSVYVDQDQNIADEEVTYGVADVQVG